MARPLNWPPEMVTQHIEARCQGMPSLVHEPHAASANLRIDVRSSPPIHQIFFEE